MAMFQNNNKNTQLELLTYKLLHDILFIVLLFLGGLLLADGVIPGFFSGYVGFTNIILAIAATILGIIFLGKRNELLFSKENYKKSLKRKFFVFILFLSTVLIINALFKFSWWEMIIGTAFAIVIFVYLLKVFTEEKQKKA
jgi:hypothetical protein